MSILVTGGAGYIGSVTVEQLIHAGQQVVVFDNLSQGHKKAVHPDATLIEGDLSERTLIDAVFAEHEIDAVIHFAARSLVGQSVECPFLYLGDNVTNGLNLLESMANHGVKKFILSSTANLFDDPENIPINETEQIVPGSPYGESKYILERMLFWLEKTQGLKYAALRYFNAAGASEQYGEDHDPETHLIPIVLQVALGKRDHIPIFGNDYETTDGTCVRDYVHVVDLAQAHILALNALDQGSRTYNLGSGQGFSVMQVIEAARQITGHAIPAELSPKRPGDVAALIASSDKIRNELGWKTKFDDLHTIIETAWDWHKIHPNGYEDSSI